LPSGDSDFSGRWKAIKAAFTRSIITTGATIPRDDRGEYLLWQRCFWEHTIRDDQDFERCANYVHFNPVKHRLVSTPVEWPFSSCTDTFVPAYCRAIGVETTVQTIPVLASALSNPDCASLHPGYALKQKPRHRCRGFALW
jgi:hypothetical protein